MEEIINLCLMITGTFSAIVGTLLYVFGSCERHSELNNTHAHPFETDLQWRLDTLR